MKLLFILSLITIGIQPAHALMQPLSGFTEKKIDIRGVEYVDLKLSTTHETDGCNNISLVGDIFELSSITQKKSKSSTYVYDLNLFQFSQGCTNPKPVDQYVVYKTYPEKQLPRHKSDSRKCGGVSVDIWYPSYLDLEVIPGPANPNENADGCRPIGR